MKHTTPILSFFASLLLLCGCESTPCEGPDGDKIRVGSDVPAFTLNAVGKEQTFASKQIDKLTLIYFLWSECGDCKRATPEVVGAWNTLDGDPEVDIICIARGDSGATIEKAANYWASVEQGNAPKSVPTLYYDANRVAFNQFASKGVPRFYLVNSVGKVLWYVVGDVTTSQLLHEINKHK